MKIAEAYFIEDGIAKLLLEVTEGSRKEVSMFQRLKGKWKIFIDREFRQPRMEQTIDACVDLGGFLCAGVAAAIVLYFASITMVKWFFS